MSRYVTVAPIPAVPSIETLTYAVPERLSPEISTGIRVVIPLGRRNVTGVVMSFEAEAPAGMQCRDVIAALDREPLLNDELLELAVWIADYYLAPLGEVLSLAIGRGLTAASRRTVALLDASLATGTAQRRVVEALEAIGGRAETARLKKLLTGRTIDAPIAALAARGAVRVDYEMPAPKVRARHERYVEVAALADDLTEASAFARSPKRKQIYDYVCGQPGRRTSVRQLTETFGQVTSQLAALTEAGLFRSCEREVYRDVWVEPESERVPTLTSPQKHAVDRICAGLGAYRTYLLQGVTASGKTEVYLRVIRDVLDAGGGALVLVPEISLTHQVVARLVGRFGQTVAVLHSELSPGERWDQWRKILRGDARIAVGARSAVLAPIERLGVIIVDEEHDAAYKQADGVRYNGRDVAIVRAKRLNCPVVLGSATPSIETRLHGRDGRYERIVLPTRVGANPLPSVEVVDLRGRDIVATGGLSEHLTDLLKRNLADGGQSLLFLNRRGYASNLQCYSCGQIVQCDSCSVGMTLHGDRHELRCHHCDSARPVPPACPSCDADALLGQGLGTQRLERAVKQLLPAARVDRLDRDIAGRRGVAQRVLSAWRRGEIDVLIGTQMIAKGHDAGGVTLVGVVQADLSLGVPDFRAAERTFQLLSQVAGRAGRGERSGRVIFQTYRPDHPAIAAAARHDYEAFAEAELRERLELGYPPYARMALLRFEGSDVSRVERLASTAARALVRLSERMHDEAADAALVVRGPAPCPIERIKGRHRYQIQLRSPDHRLIRHAASECRRLLRDSAHREGIRMSADIDPVDML